MVFYFTATGNSLYVAKQLDEERFSIPQEMNKINRHYSAERIGIVCPLFEFEIPSLVKDFIQETEFETDYFYLIVTYGMHHGGVAERTQAWLKSIGKAADYINTIFSEIDEGCQAVVPCHDLENRLKASEPLHSIYNINIIPEIEKL